MSEQWISSLWEGIFNGWWDEHQGKSASMHIWEGDCWKKRKGRTLSIHLQRSRNIAEHATAFGIRFTVEVFCLIFVYFLQNIRIWPNHFNPKEEPNETVSRYSNFLTKAVLVTCDSRRKLSMHDTLLSWKMTQMVFVILKKPHCQSLQLPRNHI